MRSAVSKPPVNLGEHRAGFVATALRCEHAAPGSSWRAIPVPVSGLRERATNYSILNLSVDQRVDLGNIAARKLHHGGIPIVRFVRTDDDRYASCFSLGEGIREVSHLVSGHLS